MNNIKIICISEGIKNQFNGFYKNLIVANIHGIDDKYFSYQVNEMISSKMYWIGKLDNNHKCIDRMITCLNSCNVKLDIFGDGNDKLLIISKPTLFEYKGVTTDPLVDLKYYGIYMSFSDLEGVCTSTVEALLMNKKVLIYDCPCNNIFRGFNNVYYFNDTNFKEQLQIAIDSPLKYRDVNLNKFKWEVCNENLYKILTI